MVFCRSSNKGHATDVDVFDGIGIGHIGFGNGFFKGIEIDRYKVDVIPSKFKKLAVVSICGAGQ